MEALDVARAWEEDTVVGPKNPTEIKHTPNKTGLKEDQIKAQVNLIWADTAQGGAAGEMPLYFKVFLAKPAD
eukprot:5265377-Ditylum_brightwellii.AAC.1